MGCGASFDAKKYEASGMAEFAKFDGDWVITEDHYFEPKQRQGQVWSFNSKERQLFSSNYGVFDEKSIVDYEKTQSIVNEKNITKTGENTFTTKADVTYQYEYHPDKDMIKCWYNEPSTKYFWFTPQAKAAAEAAAAEAAAEAKAKVAAAEAKLAAEANAILNEKRQRAIELAYLEQNNNPTW